MKAELDFVDVKITINFEEGLWKLKYRGICVSCVPKNVEFDIMYKGKKVGKLELTPSEFDMLIDYLSKADIDIAHINLRNLRKGNI